MHRIGQAQSVNVYYLHVRGSVDDIMWGMLQTKLENVGTVRPAACCGACDAGRRAPQKSVWLIRVAETSLPPGGRHSVMSAVPLVVHVCMYSVKWRNGCACIPAGQVLLLGRVPQQRRGWAPVQ